jgi:hypothetical protein
VLAIPTLILVSPEGIILEIDGLRGENLEKVLANKLQE